MDDESRDFILESNVSRMIIISWIILVITIYIPQYFDPAVYGYYWDEIIKPIFQLFGL